MGDCVLFNHLIWVESDRPEQTMQTMVPLQILLPLINNPDVHAVPLIIDDVVDVEDEVAHALLVHHLGVEVGFADIDIVKQLRVGQNAPRYLLNDVVGPARLLELRVNLIQPINLLLQLREQSDLRVTDRGTVTKYFEIGVV